MKTMTKLNGYTIALNRGKDGGEGKGGRMVRSTIAIDSTLHIISEARIGLATAAWTAVGGGGRGQTRRVGQVGGGRGSTVIQIV